MCNIQAGLHSSLADIPAQQPAAVQSFLRVAKFVVGFGGLGVHSLGFGALGLGVRGLIGFGFRALGLGFRNS